MKSKKINIKNDPYSIDKSAWWGGRGLWPCNWISFPEPTEKPFIAVYCLDFNFVKDEQVRVHVAADEHYELYFDGELIGRGNDKGDFSNWYYDTYELNISQGTHVLAAKVISLGKLAPLGRLSLCHGFILSPEEEKFQKLLGTGLANWKTQKINAYTFKILPDDEFWFAVAPSQLTDGNKYNWGIVYGKGENWVTPDILHQGRNGFLRNEYDFLNRKMHLMKPSLLPEMFSRKHLPGRVRFASTRYSFDCEKEKLVETDNSATIIKEWNELFQYRSLTIPANTRIRVIIDLEDYYCAYPVIVVSSGRNSRIKITWSEALFLKLKGPEKGNRNEIFNKYLRGIADTFIADGGEQREFSTLFWRSGRYLEIVVEVGEQALVIEKLLISETRYPLEMESSIESDCEQINSIIRPCLRSLQMSSHDTYVDCPFYEQLMYSGDGRLEALTTYAITRDNRLQEKAIALFNASRHHNGLSMSQYPSRSMMFLPTFSLWWIGMVYDYALWRGNKQFVASVMPGLRAVIDHYLSHIDHNGLVKRKEEYWNFIDWVPDWKNGVPPGAEYEYSCVINWQFVYVLMLTAKLEEYLEEEELAARCRRYGIALVAQINKFFWVPEKGLFKEDIAGTAFSEHSQCLAVLSGCLDTETLKILSRTAFNHGELIKTTFWFNHYWFEMCRIMKRIDVLSDRLELWNGLVKQGLKTIIENFEPARSECHGWGAHPIYHVIASIAGIRPLDFGFNQVRIEPQLGKLEHLKVKCVHPQGNILFSACKENDTFLFNISTPVSGWFISSEKSFPLKAGDNQLHIKISEMKNA
ncbi:MAG: Bacterial alpha-L-rhamnosidase [Smithella sp. PtaU1.Bin162]|nr:MAG: Bacterial alpha-L-rhamnosidase [Smithella sp. PtaU1.Bin162]